MRIVDLVELGPRLDPAEIDSFERRIGFLLPKDYREFLQETNGGLPPEEGGFFYIESMDWWNQIRTFYSLRNSDVDIDELDRVLQRSREQYSEHFNASAAKLPIGADEYGNKIYLMLAGPERGSVFFWMHDADDNEDDKLNSSFEAFLESIRIGQ